MWTQWGEPNVMLRGELLPFTLIIFREKIVQATRHKCFFLIAETKCQRPETVFSNLWCSERWPVSKCPTCSPCVSCHLCINIPWPGWWHWPSSDPRPPPSASPASPWRGLSTTASGCSSVPSIPPTPPSRLWKQKMSKNMWVMSEGLFLFFMKLQP